MPSRLDSMVAGLATFQLLDGVAHVLPVTSPAARLDHLGVPDGLRPALPTIKVATSVGLVVGLRCPGVGAISAAALVSLYAAAVGFHWLAGDDPLAALPATALGVIAAATFVATSHRCRGAVPRRIGSPRTRAGRCRGAGAQTGA